MLSKDLIVTNEKLNELFKVADGLCFQSYFSNLETYEGSQVIVTVQPKGKHEAYGWFITKETWINDQERRLYEINLSAEYLNRDLQDIIGTLVHEMVHLYNHTKHIQDCSRKGTYHNKNFKYQAENSGLIVNDYHEKYGYYNTKLADTTMAMFAEILYLPDYEKMTYRLDLTNDKKKPKKAKSKMHSYVCPNCGNEFKAKNDLNIICGTCYDEEDNIYKMIEKVND